MPWTTHLRFMDGSAAGVVDPSTIADLEAWYKADALTGLADGAAVASWSDSSGNGMTLSQATANMRPTYVADAVNGYPAVRFDDSTTSGDMLSGATSTDWDWASGPTAQLTVFVVMKPTTTAVTHPAIIGTNGYASAQDGFYFRRVRSSHHWHLAHASGVASTEDVSITSGTNTATEGAWHCVSGAYTAQTSAQIWSDGTASAIDTTSGSVPGDPPHSQYPLRLGAVHGSYPLSGDVAEVLLFSRNLTASERNKVHAYLDQKYALSVTSGSMEYVDTATPFGSARVTWSLGGHGAAEFSLRESDVRDGRWAWGRRRVVVKDSGGTARFQGWLDRLERGGEPGAVAYRAASRGLGVALSEGVVHGTVSKSAVVGTTIAWDLIAHAQAQASNHWGFTLGTVTGTAPARTRYYCDGDVIADAINELASTGTAGGFDWDISETGAFRAWVGGRGTDRSGTYTLDPSSCTSWQCTGDASQLVTYVTGIGDSDDNVPCGPPLVIDDNATAATWGRREVVIDSESNTESEVEEKTTDELRARYASRLNLRATWIEGRGPWSFGTVWLGDIVAANLGAAFGGTANVRLISVSVTLEGLHEFVETEWEAV